MQSTIEKCATIFIALGEEAAAEVMKNMSPKEVQQIGMAMAKIRNVATADVDAYIDEFLIRLGLESSVSVDSQSYIRKVLTRAMGEDEANKLLEKILYDADVSGIESLKWMDPVSAAELIRDEHPQVIATIMAYLERDTAAAILAKFSDRLRGDVIMRISKLSNIQPFALRELNAIMSKAMTGNEKSRKASIGGVKVAAEILNFVGGNIDQSIIETVNEQDSELAMKIQDEMFTFENIIDIDNRGIQTILRDVSTDLLVLALKNANDALKTKILSNMSKRAAEALKEDLEGRGPVKLSEVEGAQKEILKIVRKLADSGTIVIAGGDDAFV
jgi:flagellar motor switch protein FliG